MRHDWHPDGMIAFQLKRWGDLRMARGEPKALAAKEILGHRARTLAEVFGPPDPVGTTQPSTVPPAVEEKWLPMDIAPRDGGRIWVKRLGHAHMTHSVVQIYWRNKHGGCWWGPHLHQVVYEERLLGWRPVTRGE